ncbi:MAG: mono/diheme cytochrome c family protein/glucose/arabinose dehydrogenase [Candidatus Omnitrophota bacterium]|jgi:mono/diheme cytochrome c family protein/glucose/arabinose dehydrogenase
MWITGRLTFFAMKKHLSLILFSLLTLHSHAEPLPIHKNARVVLIGGGLGARVMHYGSFETELHARYPEHQLFIRNMCDEGSTPGFRPHSARNSPWAYPGAEKFRPLETAKDRWGSGHSGSGFYKTPDAWLTQLKPDLIIAFFGYSESFAGPNGLPLFREELEGFIKHTQASAYNGKAPAQLALVSPIAFQDVSRHYGTPDGIQENIDLALYATAMQEVAAAHQVHVVDLFTPTKALFDANLEPLTRDGALLTEAGYAKLVPLLTDGLFGSAKASTKIQSPALHAAVAEKNWLWLNYYKIPNGVHVFGRRHNPYGPKNYPAELNKLEQMLDVRDQAIWATLRGEAFDLVSGDAKTDALPDMGTPTATYLPLSDAIAHLTVPDGYKIELFASEERFPDLANPVQMSFDNQGRLWVSTMPSYPHYKPGDAKPDDKLLILEDTDFDGKADRQTVFARGLHLPMGFEFGTDGVYVSQGYSLVLLRDTDGDDKADRTEIVMSGFDDHDTHHAISAFCADPSGAIYMGEGTFLHSNVETAYGTIRSSNGGFFRYDPARRHLERSARLSIPNPWGIAFDDWGQNFFADTSDPNMRWMLPGTVRVGYGKFAPVPPNLLSVRVRPTSGLELVSSRHFPDEVQGDILINNTIGFLGTKQHTLEDDGTGYKSQFRQDLVKGSDGNFRPVDMEFAPDGSLYLVDWHNARIGHMQHSARDPNRDHTHGRIYRVTYPSRPLVKPADVAGASIETLLENLKLPEYRTRYRTRRELRGRTPKDVLAAIHTWAAGLDKTDPPYEHHLLEALWVTWGMNQVDASLLQQLLHAQDFRARAAAVHVLRYCGHQVPEQVEWLMGAAGDPAGRVRMEAITAASWLGKTDGIKVLQAAAEPRTTEAPLPIETGVARIDGKGILHFRNDHLKTRYVDTITVSLPGPRQTLNLSEVEIISHGKNVAAQAKASQSSRYDDVYVVSFLTDGDLTNFAHSKVDDTNPSFTFTFAKAIIVDEVIIHNRTDYESRFKDGEVHFSAAGKSLLKMTVNLNTSVLGKLKDPWLAPVFQTAEAYLQGQKIEADNAPVYTTHLTGADKAIFLKGAEVFNREAHCITCHQPDGLGLPAAQFPPLASSEWVTGNEERLIKLTLHGLMGPIEVNGSAFPGVVPMPPFKMLSDEELAAVLSFVRNTFGNQGSIIQPQTVKRIRSQTQSQSSFYPPAELLKTHPR